jgi:hypothetical protein
VPERLSRKPKTTVWAEALDADGRVVADVHGTHPQFDSATGAAEANGRLYLVGPNSHDLLVLDFACP